MTEKTNPFPAYPVVRLKDDVLEVQSRTIATAAVQESRERLQAFIDRWKLKASNPDEPTEPLVVRVQGDYGTGKTHLLLDAAAKLQKDLSSQFPDATVIRVACLDTDPLEWFRQGFGAELRRPFLKNSMVRLYALAGQHVAESAELTRAAADRLNDDYRLIFKFIKDDVLNVTAVEERLQSLLLEVCPEASDDIKKALTGLVSAPLEKAATKWLSGEKLSPSESEKLRLPSQLSSEFEAANVLIAAGAIQHELKNPFGVMIDELEHLTRRDDAGGGKGNITWLKRVIEGLAKYRALIYVSGHDSAWGMYSDFFDRFSQYKPITLRKWSGDDIVKLVYARAPEATPDKFGLSQAEQIATLTGGNVRRVVSICRTLFRETSGFNRPVTPQDVRRVAEQIGQTISIGEATERVREIAENSGLRVQPSGVLETKETNPKKIQFDLVAFKANEPRLVVELKHALDQQKMGDMARRFVAQMGEIVSSYPAVIGCLIVDGNVDDEVLSLLRSDQRLRILSFDLTQRDAINLIERDLAERLRDGQNLSPEAARLKELEDKNVNIEGRIEVARRDDNQKLIQQLQKERKDLEAQVSELRVQLRDNSKSLENELSNIEERRKSELEELYKRLEQMSAQISSPREREIVAPQQEEVTARLQTTYTDLTKSPPFSMKLRLALGNFTSGLAVLIVILGIVLSFMAGEIAEFAARNYGWAYSSTKFSLIALSVVCIVQGGFIIWRKFTLIDRYLDYTAGILREVYLQTASPMDLVRVRNILYDSLEERGPYFGRRLANERLVREFPYIFGYLHEHTYEETIDRKT